MNRIKIVRSSAEIIGLLVLILSIIIRILFGLSLDDFIFNRVISIVSTALFLRHFPHVLFYSMLFVIGVLLYWTYTSYKIETETNNIILAIRILNGWLIGNLIIYFQINAVFYRNAIVTYQFLLGSIILILTICDFVFNPRMNQQHIDLDTMSVLSLTRYVVFGGLALLIIIPTMVPMSGFQPTPPADPVQYGGDLGPYAVETTRLTHQVPSNISDFLIPDNDNSSWYIFVYTPQIIDQRQVPLTIFAHGYTGTNPADYLNSLHQLASRGNAVVFVQYATDVMLEGEFSESEETNFTRSNAMYIRYLMEWSGILQAVKTLESGSILGPGTVDTDYIQIIGHSVGGGMVPYLATNAVEMGWGKHQMILDLETPWYSSEHPLVQYNLSKLPVNTMVNVVGTKDDHLASPCIGMAHFEKFYAILSINNLAYLIIPSDYHGFPRLVATHYVVTTAIDDTLTKWGYLKRVDAMAGYLGALANNIDTNNLTKYFLGGSDTMVSQGLWSDGTAVNPLEFSQDPFGQRGGDNLAQLYLDAHEAGPEICAR